VPNEPRLKTIEDIELEREQKILDRKVKKFMETKQMEFSFEVSKERKHFKEVDDLQEIIDRGQESYRLFKKTGRIKEARMMKKKIQEVMYSKEHLSQVMNLDFSKPTQKMKEMSLKYNIDLKDPSIIDEFKRI